MSVTYKKLWKLLIDKEMKKQDLQKAANISAVTIAKLGRNENVTTTILAKICAALNCNVGDIIDIVEPNKRNEAELEEKSDAEQNN